MKSYWEADFIIHLNGIQHSSTELTPAALKRILRDVGRGTLTGRISPADLELKR